MKNLCILYRDVVFWKEKETDGFKSGKLEFGSESPGTFEKLGGTP